MVTSKIARWVNLTYPKHNNLPGGAPRINQLQKFKFGHTSLQRNDFESYLPWVKWCRDQADMLNKIQPMVKWRPRDVEMACFTDEKGILPQI
ncbi:hypothetical protein FJZ31_11210 [Candidatus Poribacteria bacterium]|nr:hypothetical protein [Candidatus Poribacteria bacterium]